MPISSAASETAHGDRLQLMATFVRIVEAGSLSAAAAQLRTAQPTISRRLQSLERSLGVRLLQRTTHAMRLTVDGERCYARAKDLLAGWAAFEADLRGAQVEPEGLLRVALPHAFGQERFVAPLARFLAENPQVAVDWLLRDDVRDFIANGIDCAIQVGEPADPTLVAIRLGEVPRMVVGAPALLKGRRAPLDIDELGQLPWLALRTFYRDRVTLTHVRHGEVRHIPIQPRVGTDSLYALRSAALLGLGAAIGSSWLLAEDVAAGRLRQLCPDWRPASLPVHLVYPHARFYPSRLQRFVATMRAAIPEAIG